MCAMLALVAPEELKLEFGRTIQFVEAYVGEWVQSESYRSTISESFTQKTCWYDIDFTPVQHTYASILGWKKCK